MVQGVGGFGKGVGALGWDFEVDTFEAAATFGR